LTVQKCYLFRNLTNLTRTMQLESLSEILTCIKNWESIRGDAKELSVCLDKTKSFSYTITAKESDYLHIYPGICNETKTFYMFLINEADDRERDEQELFKTISQCVVKKHLGDDVSIPEETAKQRMAAWVEKGAGWIEEELEAGRDIFQAFNLPAPYMQAGESYRSYFALKEDPETLNTGGFVADLVTTSISATIKAAYYDFVRPVPPFDPLQFYLLSIAR
jgi:DNA phosphorothioation-dependent restriction protein DptG